MKKFDEIFASLPDYKDSGIGVNGELPLLPVNLTIYYRDADVHRSIDRIFCHDSYIMIWVLSGSRMLEMDDCKFLLQKGDVFIIPPFTRHKNYDADPDFKGVMASFKVAGDNNRMQSICRIRSKITAAVRNALVFACKAYKRWSDGDPGIADEAVCLFGIFLSKLCSMNAPGFVGEKKYDSDDLVSRVVSYLAVNRDHHVTLAELSHQLHCSGSLIRQTFKKKTGRSIGNYELSERLRQGVRLLSSTNLSIGEIAERCGFNSSKGFLFAVKRECKCTPREIRKRK